MLRRKGLSKHNTSIERRTLLDNKWTFSFLLFTALHPIAGVKGYSRDPGPFSISADASLMSCGPEKQADVLSKCANNLCDVTQVVTIFPNGEELCGYCIFNILPEPEYQEDESFVALKRAKKNLPACTTCKTEKYLLDFAGRIVRGPETCTETIKTSAPSAVEFQASFEAAQGIAMSWETPHSACPISHYQISCSVLDLNDPQQPKTVQSINLESNYSNFIQDDVKHNSLYEVCMIAVAVGEVSGPETCKSIVIPKLGVEQLEAKIEADQGITVSWHPPKTLSDLIHYEISYTQKVLDNSDQLMIVKIFEVESSYSTHVLSDVQPNSSYEICVFAMVENSSGGKNCTSIETPNEIAPDVESLGHIEEYELTEAEIQHINAPVVDGSSSEIEAIIDNFLTEKENPNLLSGSSFDQLKSNGNSVNLLPVQGLMTAAIVLLTGVLL
ncbi:uncharacterized protein LOC108668407 [Hyalella azteca]|uniref:Uncharacterized protein LOC108668407 n=1 Tax=Hyalella azteca TaxID=294128 RepID=A0A8B7NBY4_HYAAZ|nr:uncharacterized protein LOC108668407 [Hyalella azteca]